MDGEDVQGGETNEEHLQKGAPSNEQQRQV